MKGFLKNLFWFFEGSKLFAFICLMLGLMFGVFGYLASEKDATWQAAYYGFAAVLAVMGVSFYVYKFFDGSAGGRHHAR
jgi:hypothetical protein